MPQNFKTKINSMPLAKIKDILHGESDFRETKKERELLLSLFLKSLIAMLRVRAFKYGVINNYEELCGSDYS